VDAIVAEVRVFEDAAGHELSVFEETRRRIEELKGRLSSARAK